MERNLNRIATFSGSSIAGALALLGTAELAALTRSISTMRPMPVVRHWTGYWKRSPTTGGTAAAPGTTPATPSLPFACRGLCGKLWRVPRPP